MTTADTLRAARALIEQPERWTQNAYARDDSRQPCSPTDLIATCWCATGAISRVSRWSITNENKAWDTLNFITGVSVARFNDSRTHAEVLAAFDRAIEIAEKQ